MLEALAEKYALIKNTRLIAFRMEGNQAIFVLESGQKLIMTEAELIAKLDELRPILSAPPAAPPPLPTPLRSHTKTKAPASAGGKAKHGPKIK